jgi:hypothetical protein
MAKSIQQDATLITKLLERYQVGLSFWGPRFDSNRTIYRDYRQEAKLVLDPVTGKPRWPWKANIFTPDTYEKASLVIPAIKQAIMAREQFYAVTRRKGTVEGGDVDLTSTLLDYCLYAINFRGLMDRVIPEVVLLGSKIVRLRWIRKEEWFDQRNRIYDLGVNVGVKEERILEEVYEGPEVVSVPYFRLFIDPATPPCELQDATWIQEEQLLPEWKFLNQAEFEGWGNAETREQVLKASSGQSRMLSGYDDRALPFDKNSRGAHLLHCWDHDRYVVLALDGSTAAGGIILKDSKFEDACPDEKYPHRPIFSNIHVDEGVEVQDLGRTEASAQNQYDIHPSGFYPPGLLHHTHGLQKAQNINVNQMFDHRSRIIDPAKLVYSEALEDEAELDYGIEPDQYIHLKQVAGLPINSVFSVMPMGDPGAMGYLDTQRQFRDWFSGASGGNPLFVGRPGQADPTATAVAQDTTNANLRFTDDIDCITRNGIEPILETIVEMYARYVDADTMGYIVGEDGPQVVYPVPSADQVHGFIQPEDIVRRAHVKIRTLPHYKQEMILQRWMQLLPVLSPIMPFIDLTEIARQMLKADPYLEDVDNIIPKNAPKITPIILQQIQAMVQMQQQLQMQGIGPQGPGQPGLNQGPNAPQTDAQMQVRALSRTPSMGGGR